MIYENQDNKNTLEGSNWPDFPGYAQTPAPVPRSAAPKYYINSQTANIAEFDDLLTAVRYLQTHNPGDWTLEVYDPTPDEYEEELRLLRHKNRLNPLY